MKLESFYWCTINKRSNGLKLKCMELHLDIIKKKTSSQEWSNFTKSCPQKVQSFIFIDIQNAAGHSPRSSAPDDLALNGLDDFQRCLLTSSIL